MEVLCAYVRNTQNCGEPMVPPAGVKVGEGEGFDWFYSVKEPRVDVQAALAVIGDRPPERVAFEADRGLILDLSGANLQRARLKRMFARAILSRTHLDRTHLLGGRFEGTHFDLAHLRGANLRWAHLKGASLYGAHLEQANLEGAILEGAHLEYARSEGAYLRGTNLSEAHLEGAILFDTDLSKVNELEPDGLAEALGDATTTLPEGVQRPANWPNGKLDETERGKWIRSVAVSR